MSGSESCRGVSAPTIELLTQELNKVAKWQTLGTNLGMAPCEITEIEQDHPGDTARRRTAMLDKWLKKHENPSWMSIIEALEKMSEMSLAKHLRNVYVSLVSSADDTQLVVNSSSVLLEVHRSDAIVKKIENLRCMYYKLVTETESDLEKANLSSKIIKRFSQIHVGDDVTCATIEELIDQLKPFFFFDYALLETIIMVLLWQNQSAVSKLNDYIQQLEQFKKSTTLQQFIENIETAQNTSPQTCTVTLQLVGGWLPKTISDLEKLLKEIFHNKAAVLTRLKIVRKCVLVTYLVQRSEAISLNKAAQSKISFMMKLGVSVLQVGDTVVTSTQSEMSDFSFESSLIRSVKENDINVLRFLLDINTSPDATDDDQGLTGLLWASYLGRTKAAKLLLKANGDPNLHSIDGVTPLFAASQSGHSEIVSFLLLAYANPNLCRDDGVTPLLMASQEGHPEIVSFLLNAYADPNICRHDGVTPLLMASQNGHSDIVSFLLKDNADPKHCGDNGVTPLFVASQNGHSDVVSFLLEAKADPNCYKDYGVTPLFMASQKGHSDIVSFLLNANANSNIGREDGVTPLIMASQNGHFNVVISLLKANANPNHQTDGGMTSLMAATSHPRIVQLLLTNGANPYLRDSNNSTALDFALRSDCLESIKLLLDDGTDSSPQTTNLYLPRVNTLSDLDTDDEGT